MPLGDDPATFFIPGITPVRTTDTTGQPVSDIFGNPIYQSSFCNLLANQLTPTCESQGKFITSLIGYSLSWDRRDDPIDPTRGWRFSLSQAVAGLGGDVQYWRSEVNGAYYVPLIGKFVGALKFRGGYVDGYGGDTVRLSDRFFEGASTFRGFEVAGVGPRYIQRGATVNANGDIPSQAIGGKVYAIGSAEILLPLPLPKQYGIRAALFTDFGTVGLVDNATKALNEDLAYWVDPDGDGIFMKPVQDDLSLRVSAGVTVSWDSPFGPVRFDLARVLRQEEYDRVEEFRFSAGTSF